MDVELYDDSTVEQVDAIVEWVKDAASITTLSAVMLYKAASMYHAVNVLPKAIELYQEAEEMEPTLHQAISFRARATESLGKTEEAIELMSSVIHMQEEQGSSDHDTFQENQRLLAEWHEALGHHEEACTIYRLRLKKNPLDFDSVYSLINIYIQKNDHESGRELLNNLAKQEIEGCDVLTALIMDIEFLDRLRNISRKAKEAGCLELLNDTLTKAIDKSIHKHRNAHARLDQSEEYAKALATLLRLHYFGIPWLLNYTDESQDRQRLIQQAEKATKHPTMDDYDASRLQRQMAYSLCSIHLQQAKNTPSNSEAEKSILKKVRGYHSRDSLVTSDDVDRMLTAYHASRGNLAAARDLLRYDVKIGLDLLSDEDKDNDWQGYEKLGVSFLRCKDDRNALAAFSMIGPLLTSSSDDPDDKTAPDDKTVSINETAPESAGETLEESQATTTGDPSSEAEQLLEGPISRYCDGCVNHNWTYASDMYWCRVCRDIQLCKGCFDTLDEISEDERSGLVNCREHEFFHVPPWNATKSEQMGEDMIEVEGRSMSIEDWKSSIRKTWELL